MSKWRPSVKCLVYSYIPTKLHGITSKKKVTLISSLWQILRFAEKFKLSSLLFWGHAVAQLVEALRYKPEGRGFDSRWCHWNFLERSVPVQTSNGIALPFQSCVLLVGHSFEIRGAPISGARSPERIIFFMMMSNIYGFLVWNFFSVTLYSAQNF